MDKCKGCGKCCKEFGKPSNAKVVLCQSAVSGLFMFPWEYRRLKTSRMRIARQIFPDSISKTNIVVGYIIKNQPCVFYKGKCQVYQKRPLTCIAYPRSWSKGCPTPELFLEKKDLRLATVMGEDLYELCIGLINKAEIEGKVKLVLKKKDWAFKDIDKFFKFQPLEFNEAKSRRLQKKTRLPSARR
jgi:Fe-S-cluster containining protein